VKRARRIPAVRVLTLWCTSVLFVLYAYTPAARAALIVDLSVPLIELTTGFNGADVVIFGAVDSANAGRHGPLPLSRDFEILPGLDPPLFQPPSLRGELPIDLPTTLPSPIATQDVVVVVRGPPRDLTVRRRARLAGMWLNVESRDFEDEPGFYAVMTTDEAAFETLITAGEPRIIPFDAAAMDVAPPFDPFRAAMVRGMIDRGLYDIRPGGVTLQGDRLFRANLRLPPNVPTGIYTVTVFNLAGGQVIDTREARLSVSQAGLGAVIYSLAETRPLSYGLLAVTLAMLSGWLGHRLFRRP